MGDLFQAYARIAPNSIIPSKKHRAAIKELSKFEPPQVTIKDKARCESPKPKAPKLHCSKKSDNDVIDFVDEMIRIGFSQFRRLAQSAEIKTQTFRKCTPLQVERIEAVLCLMSVGKDDWVPLDLVPGMTPEDTVRQPERMPSTASLGVSETSGASPAPKAAAIVPKTMEEAEAIFAAALATEDLDLEQFATPTKSNPPGLPSSPMALHKFVGGDPDESCDDADDIFKEAAETIPIGMDGKSQLKIFRTAGGKSSSSNVGKIKGLKNKSRAEHPKPESGHKDLVAWIFVCVFRYC